MLTEMPLEIAHHILHADNRYICVLTRVLLHTCTSATYTSAYVSTCVSSHEYCYILVAQLYMCPLTYVCVMYVSSHEYCYILVLHMRPPTGIHVSSHILHADNSPLAEAFYSVYLLYWNKSTTCFTGTTVQIRRPRRGLLLSLLALLVQKYKY